MANPLRGEATFRAGAAEYTLLFDVNAFCELEADSGLGVNEIVEQAQGAPSFRMLRDIFCAGLQAKHPGTSKIDAGNIMSDAGVEEMTGALRRALQAALPEAREGDENPPKGARKSR